MMSTRPPVCAFVGMILCGSLLLGAFWGCAPKSDANATAATQPAMTDAYTAYRESITKSKPGSMVGQVLATYQQYAAIADIAPKDLKAGQTITFVDATGATVGNGMVVGPNGDSSYLQVKFEASSAKRPLQKGDYAVYLKD